MAGSLPLVVLLGPTAVGKTALAMRIAEACGGELIGADSRQIYRHMDIGTAKPTREQQGRVRHHLIDLIDPDVNLSLAQYQKMAVEVIRQLHGEGRLPLLVGGTGQYITAILEGWTVPEIPPNGALRSELEVFAQERGSMALHERLALVDPVAAARIDHRNVRRVIRALEVCMSAGQPMSQLQQKSPPPYRVLHLGLTLDRAALYERADQRVDEMIHSGLVEEVRGLLKRGYDRKLPSMSGIGYQQICEHLLDGIELEKAIASTKNATHDFIRRQYTWFRGHDPGILWHNSSSIESSQIVTLVERWLEGQH
ncbi:MAG: tRNA (adenosine(37)-N6)-dimethylallyltransferase MiaA [Anaerolineae bacterium]|nr:tRNA (adenosine(37)-N6)-dimethylallyltransferase MiaA [Anaerolineae bacterium]